MVFLTMTPTIVEALEKVLGLERLAHEEGHPLADEEKTTSSSKEEEDKNILEADLASKRKISHAQAIGKDGEREFPLNKVLKEPSLSSPKRGNPISHRQIIDLSRQLKAQGPSPSSLEVLLRGSRVYIPPPPPKPEPVSTIYAADLPHN